MIIISFIIFIFNCLILIKIFNINYKKHKKNKKLKLIVNLFKKHNYNYTFYDLINTIMVKLKSDFGFIEIISIDNDIYEWKITTLYYEKIEKKGCFDELLSNLIDYIPELKYISRDEKLKKLLN